VAVRQAWAARILLCDEHAVELAGEERLTLDRS